MAPKKVSKTELREAYYLFSGVILSFALQLLYDILREDPFYQNIMPIGLWRVVLVVGCGILFFLMVRYLRGKGLD
jgi:hypothetical protein